MIDWPHAPLHWTSSEGTYMVTAGTYLKRHYFKSPEKLTILQNSLLTLAKEFKWDLHAWAIFSNHYHFIGTSPDTPENLSAFISNLHSTTAKQINIIDEVAGRKVWYQFWDTKLTFQKSYLARLNYVHNNPVKHGLVVQAELYPWCSAKWFEQKASKSFQGTLKTFDINKVSVFDEF